VSDNSAILLGDTNCWALDEATPRDVDEAEDADDETTKDVADGTRAAVVAIKQAMDVVFIVLVCWIDGWMDGWMDLFYY